MPIFRKRPVVIEARQLAGATSDVHGVYQWIESHTSGSFDPLAVLGGDESGLAESAAVTAYGREHGTSGNQHDIARLLAGARRNDPEWSAAGSVSALYPITGEPFYEEKP